MSPIGPAKIRCPRCAAEFLHPASEAKAKCPICHARLNLTPGDGPSMPVPPPLPICATGAPHPGGPPVSPKERAGFLSYLRRHFSRSHGPAAWGICAGLLGVPLISLAKPLLGIIGTLAIVGSVLAVAMLVGIAYFFQRLVAFTVRKERTVDEQVRSRLAATANGCLMFLIPVGLLAAVECVTPPHGLVATLVPEFRDEQARWLKRPAGPLAQAPAPDARANTAEPAAVPAEPLAPVAAGIAPAGSGNSRTPAPEPQAGDDFKNISVDHSGRRQDQGRSWAVIVGVNRYEDPRIPALNYCVADAHLVANTLRDQCGYQEEKILLLTDDQPLPHLQPRRRNLQTQIPEWLKNAELQDTVLVFFSGHGFLDDAGQSFLAPQDCDKANLAPSGFSTGELRQQLHECKAKQKMLVLDCCHAGGLRDAASPGVSSEVLALAFREASGLITLASCQKEEQSREWQNVGQGLFTYFLVQGLQGEGDFDRNAVVDSDELYRYTLEKVRTTAQRELNSQQTPVRYIPPDVVGVFPLARLATAPSHQRLSRTIRASFVLRERDERGSPVQGANVELLRRAGEKQERLGSAVSDAQGKAEIAVTLDLAEQSASEYAAAVSGAGVTRSWTLPGFPETARWNLYLPVVEAPTPSVSSAPPAAPSVASGGAGEAITNSLGMKLVLILPGEFMMGGSREEYANTDERPQHKVRITRAYYLGAHEVTVGQFRRFVSAAKYETKDSDSWRDPRFPQTDEHPVVHVAWDDAVAFCQWLSRKEQRSYRLPTEAEWEYGCRAGASTRYCFGDSSTTLWDYAWFNENSGSTTHPIGQKRPNAWGLYDMHGNVYEWCADWYAKDYSEDFDRAPVNDPTGPASGTCRTLRGGCYAIAAQALRAAARYGLFRAASSDNQTGFRVACDFTTLSVAAPANPQIPKPPAGPKPSGSAGSGPGAAEKARLKPRPAGNAESVIRSLLAEARQEARAQNMLAALELFEQTLEIVEEIENLNVKDRALEDIAKAQSDVAEFISAAKTAEKISDKRRKCTTICDVAKAQAQAGDVAAAKDILSAVFSYHYAGGPEPKRGYEEFKHIIVETYRSIDKQDKK